MKSPDAEVVDTGLSGGNQLLSMPMALGRLFLFLRTDRQLAGKWGIFKVKRNSDGSVERYKGKSSGKKASHSALELGPTLRYFAPTFRMASIRTIRNMPSLHSMTTISIPLTSLSAFLNGDSGGGDLHGTAIWF